MIETFTADFPAIGDRENRTVYVYIPDEYIEDTKSKYPVLYMLDGHNVFFDEDSTYGKSWGMGVFLSTNPMPIIIVAIESNRNEGNERLREYSPFTFEDPVFGKVIGRGRTTINWIVNELKPYIDENYPTMTDRETTFIAGSSMGGLLSIYALMNYNHIFSRAAALSPSLWTSPWKVERLINNSNTEDGTVLYMDYGSEELRSRDMGHTLSSITAKLIDKGVFVTTRIVPWGDHSEGSWEKQIPYFLSNILYDI